MARPWRIEVRTERPYLFSGLYERCTHPAPGLDGGRPGATGAIETSNGEVVEPKISRMLPADTVVTLHIPGGGGFGDPAKRSADAIREDILDGYVTPDGVRRDYGVKPT